MPSRNILKIDIEDAYYHIYARGNSKQQLFFSAYDYSVFLNLLKRYLSPEPIKDNSGREYPHLRNDLELLAYCIMPNHFHLLIYQINAGAMACLMRGIMTSFSRYFNAGHAKSGPVFESRYKASMITAESYLEHISRYIHLNPKGWRQYPYSSIHSYVGERREPWLKPDKIVAMFESSREYLSFVEDYEDHKKMLDSIKIELAGLE